MDGGPSGTAAAPLLNLNSTDIHQIRLNISYCSAGLMTMAVEGAKQLAEDQGLRVLGYEVQDVHFQQSIMIPPEEDGVEVVMQFRTPMPDTSDSRLVVYAFVIDSLAPAQKEWRRNCVGRILTHINIDEISLVKGQEQYRNRYEGITAACEYERSPEALYVELTNVGMAFGAAFQNLIRISNAQEQVSCSIRVPNTAGTMPENVEYPHAIHPTLLESLTHMMIPALTGPKIALKETLVPKFVDSVYISNHITAKSGDILQGYATAKWHNSSLAEGDIIALDPQKTQPLVTITKMQYKSLPTWDVGANEWQPTIETSTRYRKLCSQMTWKIDPESFRPNEIIDIATYLDCLFHKNSSFKIVQVGGDPADVTSALLRVATGDGSHTPLFSSLLYTAASAKAIADAGVVLAKWSAHVQFEILNIEEDLAGQNFEPGTIDLVIADATAQMPGRTKRFLSQIRALMKPKGTMLIEGDVTKMADVDPGTFGFASLNLGKSVVHPVIIDNWKRILMERGFVSGPILNKTTAESEVGHTQLIVAANTEDDSVNSQISREALIVRPLKVSQELSLLMAGIVKKLSRFGLSTTTVDMYTAIGYKLESCLVVNMVEIEESLLENMESTAFEAMKGLVLRSKSLLWVTMGDVMTGESPAANMANGFACTVRYETDSHNFATLDLGSVSQLNQIANYSEYADAVGSVAHLLCEEPAGPVFEREFAYRGGHLYVPRVNPLEDINDWLNGPDEKLKPEILRLDQIGCPIQVCSKTKSVIEDLYCKEDPLTLDPIAENHVQIDVKVSALNNADLATATENMGLECAGFITELGKNVRHIRKGDRVMAIGPGCHRTTIRTSEDLCQRIPESLSIQQGASIPLAYCTAYLALIKTAKLKSHESVLIHDSPDGIDQAVAEIALHLGAKVFILTNSLEKRALMIENLHIAEAHILAIDNLELPKSLMRLTEENGVDVVIGNSPGELMRQSWHCIANFGRYVNLHTVAGLEHTAGLDMRPFSRSATFSSVDVVGLLEHDLDQVSRIFRDVRCLLDQGSISSISPINPYEYSKLSECFENKRSGELQGKTVLSAQSQNLVPVC